MVKLKGPALGLQASGGLAKTLIYSKTGNTSYVKRWAAPANPGTNPQTAVRAIVAFVTVNWPVVSDTYKATWNDLAQAQQITPLNACIGYNIKRWNRFAYPVTTLDPTLPQINGSFFTYWATVVGRRLNFSFWRTTQNDDTGILLHRSTSNPPVPSRVNLVRITPWGSDPTFAYWTDRPPIGTYYYQLRVINAAGDVRLAINRGPYTTS